MMYFSSQDLRIHLFFNVHNLNMLLNGAFDILDEGWLYLSRKCIFKNKGSTFFSCFKEYSIARNVFEVI